MVVVVLLHCELLKIYLVIVFLKGNKNYKTKDNNRLGVLFKQNNLVCGWEAIKLVIYISSFQSLFTILKWI